MKAVLLTLSFVLAATAHAAGATADAQTEGGSIDVEECVNGACGNKAFDTPALHDVSTVDAIYNSLMNPAANLPSLQPPTTAQ